MMIQTLNYPHNTSIFVFAVVNRRGKFIGFTKGRDLYDADSSVREIGGRAYGQHVKEMVE